MMQTNALKSAKKSMGENRFANRKGYEMHSKEKQIIMWARVVSACFILVFLLTGSTALGVIGLCIAMLAIGMDAMRYLAESARELAMAEAARICDDFATTDNDTVNMTAKACATAISLAANAKSPAAE